MVNKNHSANGFLLCLDDRQKFFVNYPNSYCIEMMVANLCQEVKVNVNTGSMVTHKVWMLETHTLP